MPWKSIVLVLVFALSAGGCGGGAPDLEALKREACACKVATCADAVYPKLVAARKYFKDKNPTEAQTKIGEEIANCLAKNFAGPADTTMP